MYITIKLFAHKHFVFIINPHKISELFWIIPTFPCANCTIQKIHRPMPMDFP